MNTLEIFTERQVEAIFGFSIPYLRRARRERHGPRYLKVGKLVRYRRTDIESFLAAHEVVTTAQRNTNGVHNGNQNSQHLGQR